MVVGDQYVRYGAESSCRRAESMRRREIDDDLEWLPCGLESSATDEVWGLQMGERHK